jgi:SAM-dependent methyltransferase
MVNRRFTSDLRFKGARLTTTFPSSYDAGTFDLVFATEVIEHLDDGELDGLLAECRRLLKPGGFVLFTTPNNEDYDASKMMCPDCGCIFHKWQHVRVWTPSTLKAYVEPHGFATTYLSPIAWQSWKGKLLSIARTGKINKSGLLYVGQRSS